MYLLISNKGLIEPGALSLMGASVKDDGAIGKFGSGFKYALATLLRNKIAVRVFSGHQELKIETKPESFRNETFQVLWIEGIRTSITTQTGREWHVRDAIREIYSNALDEGGGAWRINGSGETLEDCTTIAIDLVGEVNDMVQNWTSYFVNTEKAVYESSYRGRILEQSTTNFYRRGVWICEDRENAPLFSYDFKDIDLPESRKIKSNSASFEVYALLGECTNVAVFEKILKNIHKDSAERTAIEFWGLGANGQEAMMEAFRKHWDYVGLARMRDRIDAKNARVLWVDSSILKRLCDAGAKDIAIEYDYSDDYTIVPWPIGYKDRLQPTLAFLASKGVDLSSFKIEYADHNNGPQAPIAFVHKGRCCLTAKAFEAHPDMLMKALVEEWTHLEHKVADYTAAQQHVYLDLIIKLMKGN